MKRLTSNFLFGALFSLISMSCFAATEEAKMIVDHMSCATCPIVVKGALFDLEGVDDVSISMENKIVVVKFDNEKVSKKDLVTAVTNSGFPAKLIKG